MREPSINHAEMQDNEDQAAARGGTPFYMHSRKDRRKLAKSFKLFKGKDRSAWRAANRHMAAEAQKTIVFGQEVNHGKKRND